MKLPRTFKKITKFIFDNYFIVIFLACIAFVALVSFYKLFISKPNYIYVKVKVGQGMWWASTQKPSYWFTQAIKKGLVQKDLTGKNIAEIISVRYYHYTAYTQNQYDIYATLKLKVNQLGKSEKYSFNRSTIAVSSPIDLEFPTVQFSGTITQISQKPITDQLTETTLTLVKPYAYLWEYDAIKPNDDYFDGTDTIITVLDKNIEIGDKIIKPEFTPQGEDIIRSDSAVQRYNLLVKIKLKAINKSGQLFLNDEQEIKMNNAFTLITSNLYFFRLLNC
jgi:hypothetical protein